MKNPLSKTELTGLIFLTLIIVVITAGALVLRGCKGDFPEPPLEPEIIQVSSDSVAVEKADDDSKTTKGSRKKAERKNKNSGSKARKAGNKNKFGSGIRSRKDPFSDTIRTE